MGVVPQKAEVSENGSTSEGAAYCRTSEESLVSAATRWTRNGLSRWKSVTSPRAASHDSAVSLALTYCSHGPACLLLCASCREVYSQFLKEMIIQPGIAKANLGLSREDVTMEDHVSRRKPAFQEKLPAGSACVGKKAAVSEDIPAEGLH